MPFRPAEAGAYVADIDTPALVLDLDAFERNIETMQRLLAGWPGRIRPHAKAHKCPEIARRQVAAGAVGVCCQKVSEAEVLVRGGVGDVTIVNEIVGASKLARLARLAQAAKVGVTVDSRDNVADLERATRDAGVTVDVLVEIEIGLERCGIEPGAPAVALAQLVSEQPHLRFSGLQAYQGRAQHVRDFDARRHAARAAAAKVRETLGMLDSAGLAAATVTGGGTGTCRFDVESGVYNEIQPGSYVFMDADYRANLDESGRRWRTFEQSLFVLTTVMSRPTAGRAVVDAGLKAHSVDSGMPLVLGVPGARYTRASDEHGVIELREDGGIAIGEKLKLIPGHCDPTVNMHDWLVCTRGDRVEALWPVEARGPGF